MTSRTTDYPIEPLFLDRWSPRAFDESIIPDSDLMTIFDAARWAPSSFNYQPWRFLYAKRESADFTRFVSLLVPFNAVWATRASALVIVVSDTLMHMGDPNAAFPSHSHSFDAGSAWAQMALQATRMGYATHGMTGVDFDKARSELAVPERFHIEAAIAIGKRGDVSVLPEHLRPREMPSDRKPLDEVVSAGNFVA